MSPAIAPCGEEARAGLAGASHAGLAAAMTAGVMSGTGQWEWISTYAASDASFSTDWSPDGTKLCVCLSLSLLLSFLSSQKADSRASFDSAVASQDGVVSVWDVRSSRCVKQVRGHCQGLAAPARG
jgi:WD40 repeat protein